MKIALILGGIMLVIGLLANLLAFILDRKYKSDMNTVSKK